MPVNRVGLPPRLIDRSTIFYHSSFSCHAGLPANRIFHYLRLSDAVVMATCCDVGWRFSVLQDDIVYHLALRLDNSIPWTS